MLACFTFLIMLEMSHALPCCVLMRKEHDHVSPKCRPNTYNATQRKLHALQGNKNRRKMVSCKFLFVYNGPKVKYYLLLLFYWWMHSHNHITRQICVILLNDFLFYLKWVLKHSSLRNNIFLWFCFPLCWKWYKENIFCLLKYSCIWHNSGNKIRTW